jgi:hypothetical protein
VCHALTTKQSLSCNKHTKPTLSQTTSSRSILILSSHLHLGFPSHISVQVISHAAVGNITATNTSNSVVSPEYDEIRFSLASHNYKPYSKFKVTKHQPMGAHTGVEVKNLGI